MLLLEPHSHVHSEPLRNFVSHFDTLPYIDTEDSLELLKTLVEEQSKSKKFTPIVIGTNGDICGKSMMYELMAMQSIIHHRKDIRFSTEISDEMRQSRLQEALSSLDKQVLLKNKTELLLEDIELPEILYPSTFDIIEKLNSKGKKCRIKDTTKSLAKRRAKNKIAKKSKQRNRK